MLPTANNISEFADAKKSDRSKKNYIFLSIKLTERLSKKTFN